MKMHHLIAPLLVFAACANAGAAVQLVSLPTLPLSLPTRIAPEAVTLPTRIAPEAISLPSSPMVPLGPSRLPSMPIPTPAIMPGVKLPGPKTIPVLPTRLAAAATEDKKDAPKQQENLERIYDGRGSRQPFKISEDHYHTIPERELLDEIGVGSY